MDNKYEVRLGIGLNDSEFKKVRDKINNLTDNTHRMRIDLDSSRIHKQFDHIEKRLKNLTGTKGNIKTAIPIDAGSLEKSLSDVASTIKVIKSSIGTLDSKSGMKSLLTSINQISNALEKAGNQFEELNRNMNALSGKDLNLNFGITMGGSNPITRQAAYGNKARNETLPQLKEQMSALVKHYNEQYKSSLSEFEVLTKMVRGSGLNEGDFFTNFLYGKNSVASRMDSGSLSSQMQAHKEYIDMFKKLASLNPNLNKLDVDSVLSGFSKSADNLIKDAQDIQTGANEMDDAFDKLKQIFGGGNNFNVEGLSEQLDSIVVDLGEIKTALQGLSSGVSVDSIAKSFKELSEALEVLTTNFRTIQGSLNGGFAGATSSINQVKTGLKNVADINLKATGEQIEGLGIALKSFGFNDASIDAVVSNIKEMGVTVREVTSHLNDDGSVKITVKGIDQLENAITAIKTVHRVENEAGGTDIKISNATKITQKFDEVESAYKRTLSLAKEMGSFKIKIADLDVDKNADQIRELANQLNVCEKEYRDLNKQFGQSFTSNQIEKINREFDNTSKKLHEIESKKFDTFKFDESQKEAKELQETLGELKSIATQIGKLEFDILKLDGDANSNEVKVLESQLESLENTYDKLARKSFDFDNMKFDTSQLKELDNVFRETEDKLTRLKAKMADTSAMQKSKQEAKEQEVAFKQLLSILKQMDAINIKVAKLDTSKNISEVSELSQQFDKLEKEYRKLHDSLKSPLSSGQTSVIKKEIADAADKIQLIEAKYADARAEMARKIKLNIETGDFNKSIQNAKEKYNGLSKELQEATEGYNEFQQAIKNVDAATAANDDEALVKAMKDYEVALKRVNNELDENIAKQKKRNLDIKLEDDIATFQSKIDAWLKKNSAATKEFGARLLDLKAQAESCDRTTLDHLEREFRQVDKAAEAAGKKAMSVGDRLKTQFAKYSTYFSAASAFMYVEQGLRSMFEQVVAIDSAMTELMKVTNETDAAYSEFLTNASAKASEIGTTIDGLVTSTAGFARLGYDFSEAVNLAEVANIYAVVGDEIESVEAATQSLISTMAAFGDETDAMSVIDKFNEIGNNFAISSGGVGEALQRSASSLFAANNSLDESIALITAANTVVQDPDVVGTALKTVSMRVRGAKTEMEELGLETDGMADSTAKLQSELKALTGVDIMLDKDTFKSTYQIMEELAVKWEDLTDIQQASVTELIAGKRQGNIIASLMTNFDVAQDALQTSMDSAGSATKEHEKWLESLEAKLLQLKAAWQGFAQAFMSSDFLKGALDVLINLLEVLTKLIDTVGVLPTLLGGFALFKGFTDKNLFSDISSGFNNLRVGVKNYNEAIKSGKPTQEQFANLMSSMPQSFAQYTSGLKGAEASMGGYIKSFAGGIAKTAALNIGVGLLQGGLIALASVAISAAIKGLDKLIVSEKELAEQVDKTIGTYKDKHGALMDSKADFDSSNEASLVSRYAELSKGVSSLGTNMSLTTDEYVEYQSVCNDIAALVPSLVSGYDEQGNAILSCAGNVNELIAAYEKLIETQNNKILRDEAADIQKDFQNAMDDAAHTDNSGKKLATETKNKLEEMLNQNMTADEISEYIGSITGKGKTPRKQIIAALEEANIDVFDDDGNKIDLGTFYTTTQADDFIARAINQNGDAVRTIIDSFNADLDAEAEGMKTIAEATLSQAFDISGSKYANMSDTMQTLAKQIVDSFDATYYDTLLKDGVDVEAHINSMLDTFSELEKSGQSAEFEAVFDMQTKFNNGDVSYGEYVAAVQDADKVINNLEGVSGEVKQQLKLGLNTEAIIDDYNALTKKLGNLGISPKVSKDFLKELTAEEYSVAMDVITNWDGEGSIEDIKAAIERQMAIEGLVFDLDIEVEATGIEALNTALAESVSATGLSSDSIDALKARYVDLEQEGYDLSAMFEETSNGIHLNKAALGELEQAYAKQKLDDVDADLKTLKTEYDKLTEEINTCTDASERASLYSQRDAILQQINDCATLASQYKGLASAYNAWQNAEAAGQERDMYENLISGLENIDDEISRGWVDDATIEFLELLTGKELSTAPIEDLKKAYDGLDKKIKDTSYSARDFFTVDDEGNSTNAGVYNFLDAIGQLEEEKFGGANVVDRDDDGNIIGFNFDLVAEKDEKGNIIKNGDQVIAEALGISEELVQIMVRASDDAGFVVNIEGAYTQLADLKSEAESAKDSLIELKEKGIEQLKGIDVEFNLEAEGDELVKEQEKAVKLLDKFRKTDGTIDLEMEGAQDALDIAEFLTIKIDDLTEPKYMQIDASTVDEELKEPLENMQEFERLSKEKHLLQLTGDTEELDKTQEKMDEIAESLEDLDEETKIELGIDGLTSEEIADKLEKGEIEIPANLSIDLEMSEDLKDMRLMMMNQLGIVSDEEVKLKVGYDIDESVVDDLTDEEKEVVLSYAVENEEEFNKLTDEEKEVVVDLVTDESAIEALEEHQVEIEAFARIFGVEEVDDLEEKLYSLNDQQIQILAEVLGQVDVEKLKTAVDNLDDKTVEAIAKALGEGDVEGLKTTINGLDDKTVQAIAEALGCKDVEDLNTTIEGMDGKTVQAIAEALGIKDVDSLRGAINRLKDKDVEAIANVDGKDDVDSLKNAISNLKGKTVTIWASIKKKASNLWDKITGGSDVNGTASVNGTAFADGTTGRAFKQGNWSTNNSGTALMGELGRETIVRDGRFFTVGDTGAGFYQYKKGDIIFNHKQTEELFKNGKVTSGGGRGRALASGTAFVEGLAFDGGSNGVGGIGKVGGKAVEVKADTVNITSKSSGSSKSSSSSKKSSSKKSSEEADEFLETIDWIEIAIDRIERAIDRLDLKANSVYQTWSTRNTALVDEISEVRDEISLQQKAYDRYIKEANSVGLSSSYAEKVRNGKIDIQDITDEDLAEKIKEYQEW